MVIILLLVLIVIGMLVIAGNRTRSGYHGMFARKCPHCRNLIRPDVQKDRNGRPFSKDDFAHYQQLVVASSETIGLMKEIDTQSRSTTAGLGRSKMSR
jgi:hypothetical protein